MIGMTTQERLDDIREISGLSEDVIRRVIDAERQSIVKSLRKGERATLIGRCTFRSEIGTKLDIGGDVKTYVKIKVSPAASIQAFMSDLTGFEVFDDTESVEEGIVVRQIPSLV